MRFVFGLIALLFNLELNSAPIEWHLDTGWVPSGSDLQVRFQTDAAAKTVTSIAGALEVSWENGARIRAVDGDAKGRFAFDYGADVLARGMVTVTGLPGGPYHWIGDLPYVPQFDLRVTAEDAPRGWAFKPGVTIMGSAPPKRLAGIGLGTLIGASIPGIDGEFELDVGIELIATYETKKIVVEPIGTLTGTRALDGFALSGSSFEADVHPEGTITYSGVIHLLPSLAVTLLGNTEELPIFDVPVKIPITEVPWVFSPQHIHVPLPMLILETNEVDFGTVALHGSVTKTVRLASRGEAELVVSGLVMKNAPGVSISDPQSFTIAPNDERDLKLVFAPDSDGMLDGTIEIRSNDPSNPVAIVRLHGIAGHGAVGGVAGGSGTAGAHGDKTLHSGSCACSALERSDPPGSSGFLVSGWLAIAIALSARRGRRRAASLRENRSGPPSRPR